ncbi:MMPL family transporter [Alteromonas lipotrueiana]|uniref:MMPL family transporter n=1 Tax=Alteromonas lipotrueiana TaxID=2803815 RepID=UPI001C47422E|nr:MMPL family transporter [Alteromonas lipotrueiana]
MMFLVRLCFVFFIVAGVLFATLNPQAIQIDTNINDLNPEKVKDPGLQYALDSLANDISQRFTVVVKGTDKRSTHNAVNALQTSLDELPGLAAVKNERLLNDYLPIVTPYRFNFLTEAQHKALKNKNAEQLAGEAQRKLYQLGDGVRLIPFEDDPLGWFSDYLLAMSGGIETADRVTEKGESVVSFAVTFTDFPDNMAQQFSLYEQIKAAEQSTSHKFDVTVLHSGMFFFAVDSAQSAKADIQLIAIGSGIGVLVLMLLVFRSLLPLTLAVGSIAAGVGFGVLASIWVFGSVHVLTIVFGASLIGIVVDYSLHYFYHFLSGKNASESRKGHSDNVLRRAMLLSVITSLVGYGALSLANLTILKKIALFSCSGLAMAWLSVMILGPLVVRRPIEARQTMLKSVIRGWQNVFARRPRVLTAFGLGLAGISVVYLLVGSVNVNDDPRRFFHVSPALLEQEQAVSALTQVYEPGRYLLIRGQHPQHIYDAFDALYDFPGASREMVTGISDWLASPEDQKRNYELQATIYADGGALDVFASALGLPAASLAPVKAAYHAAEGKVLHFSTLAQQVPALPPLLSERVGQIYSFALIRKNSDLKALAAAAEAIPAIEYMNTLGDATRALKSQRKSGATLLLIAYGLVSVLLAMWYRSASAALLLLIPASASLIAVALVAASGQALNVFHIMALFLVLGLGMDYVIFAREMTAQPETTQQAILLSAVTSLLSFGLLAFSAMPVVQAFGSIILIGNTINFIAAISLFNGEPEQKE